MNSFEKLKEVRKRTERKPEAVVNTDRIQPTFVAVHPEDINWVNPLEWVCQKGHVVTASVHVISSMLSCTECGKRR